MFCAPAKNGQIIKIKINFFIGHPLDVMTLADAYLFSLNLSGIEKDTVHTPKTVNDLSRGLLETKSINV